jgi:hypothetical protein
VPTSIEALHETAAAVRLACEGALARPYMSEFHALLDRSRHTVDECVRLVRHVSDDAATLAPLTAVIAEVTAGTPVAVGVPERFMILQAILANLEAIPGLRLAPAVQACIYEQFAEFAANEARHAWCRAGTFSFMVVAKKATLRIFAGGEFYWEVSGFPRSWLPKVAPESLPQVLWYLTTKFKGVRPAYFFHLDPGRRVRALSPDGLDACYRRMAQCLALQPEVRGILTVGWLHSPDTHRISPHLAWRNQTVLDNGGVVARIDLPVEHPLVFHRSPERRKAFEEGRFTPTNGLVLWAAADLRRWAARQPAGLDDAHL